MKVTYKGGKAIIKLLSDYLPEEHQNRDVPECYYAKGKTKNNNRSKQMF